MKTNKRFLKLVIWMLISFMTLGTMGNHKLEVRANVEIQFHKEAMVLNVLGLFKGTDYGFELDREATRLEGIVMLIRLLGVETDALAWTGDQPFQDVPTWGVPYVGYAFEHGLTKGLTDTSFGSLQKLNAYQYFTFVLRALGYQDGVDFNYYESIYKASQLEIITSEQFDGYTQGYLLFYRDDCAFISYKALSAKIKGSQIKLIDRLVASKVVDRDSAIQQEVLKVYDITRGDGTIDIGITSQDDDYYHISSGAVLEAYPTADHLEVIYSNSDYTTIMYSIETRYYDKVYNPEYSSNIWPEDKPLFFSIKKDLKKLIVGENSKLVESQSLTIIIYSNRGEILGKSYMDEPIDSVDPKVHFDGNLPFNWRKLLEKAEASISKQKKDYIYFEPDCFKVDQPIQYDGQDSWAVNREYIPIDYSKLKSVFPSVFYFSQSHLSTHKSVEEAKAISGDQLQAYIDYHVVLAGEYLVRDVKLYSDRKNNVYDVRTVYGSGFEVEEGKILVSKDRSYIIMVTVFDKNGVILGYTFLDK